MSAEEKSMKHFVLSAAAAVAAFVAVPAGAVGFVNIGGGDGTFDFGPAPYFGTITGNNNGINNTIAQYTEIVPFAGLFSFIWEYTTLDVDGSGFDPAGYVLNGVYTQLTTNGFPFGSTQSGGFSISLDAGDEFGFYVSSTDGDLGPGVLSFGAGVIPEPATWAMLITGFGLVGFAARRRRAALAA
jgi:hypothetical protein